MYVAIVHLPAAPHNIEERFAPPARAVTRSLGFQSIELLRPLGAVHGGGDSGSHLVVSCWNIRTSLQGWLKSDAHRDGHRNGEPELTVGKSWLTGHEPFTTAYGAGWDTRLVAAAAPAAILNVIHVADGSQHAFEEVFRSRDGEVEEQPGFLALEVLRPLAGAWDVAGKEDRAAGGWPYVVFSRWESDAAHEDWTASHAFRRAHARRRLADGSIVRSAASRYRIVHPAFAPRFAPVAR